MTARTEQSSERHRRTSGLASEGASPDNLRAQGLRTRNEVVRVARKLLLEGGPLELSLRAVASRAGISISNLQYYFPTRLAVMRAVMEPEINAYFDALRQVLDRGVSACEAFDAVLQREVNDAKDAKYVAWWRHFFLFAATDPEFTKLHDEWDDSALNQLAQLAWAR